MTQINKADVPRLRFPGFSEPLSNVKLGDVASFSKGKGISKNDITPDGALPCIRYGELYTVYDTVIDEPLSRTDVPASALTLSRGNEVLIPASGEDAKDIATAVVVKKAGIALGGDLNIIRSENDGAFLASYLSGRKRMALAAMAQGNSVVHLYPAQLKTLDIHLPTLPEQQKIASFLGALDTKIAQLVEKKRLLEDYKKGCMQQLFSRKISFKDDQGEHFPEWEEKPLGSLLKERLEKSTKSNELPVLSSTKDGVFLQKDYFRGRVASSDNSGYKILRPGQIVLSPQNLWLGNINFYEGKIAGVVSPSYKIFDIRKETVLACFARYLIRTPRMFYEYSNASEQGASVVRRNLDMNLFESIPVLIPHINEQRKIGDFLSAIDRKIVLVREELEHAKTFKQGLLQQMFV